MCVQGHDLDRVTEEGERKERKRDETAAVRHSGLALEQSQHQAGTVQGIPLCVMLPHHLRYLHQEPGESWHWGISHSPSPEKPVSNQRENSTGYTRGFLISHTKNPICSAALGTEPRSAPHRTDSRRRAQWHGARLPVVGSLQQRHL